MLLEDRVDPRKDWTVGRWTLGWTDMRWRPGQILDMTYLIVVFSPAWKSNCDLNSDYFLISFSMLETAHKTYFVT